ncbi:MAG: hypothetical protein EHM33_23680 [Chloroflexi bacterium]|nr:MAG: hypothetical protein EHM33_23680 [Chloroflexota bacterium]
MKLRFCFNVLLSTILLSTISLSCASVPSEPIALAAFNENFVDVSITLERDPAGNAVLSATFTPSDGHHLYSKDIPVNGVMGLGRPTLIELTEESQITALGELIESAQAQEPDFEPKELFVYPAGAVTLRLPVQLPPGNSWIEDEIKITYMACTAYQCKPPVEGKIVPVRIPGAEAFESQ